MRAWEAEKGARRDGCALVTRNYNRHVGEPSRPPRDADLRFAMGTGSGVKKRRVKACKPWQEAISRIRYGQNSWEYGLAEQMRMTVGVGTTHPASQSCRAVLHSRLMLRARFREARQHGAGGENVSDFSGKNGLIFFQAHLSDASCPCIQAQVL